MKYHIFENFITKEEIKGIIDYCEPKLINSMSPATASDVEEVNSKLPDGANKITFNTPIQSVPGKSMCYNRITWVNYGPSSAMNSVQEKILKCTKIPKKYRTLQHLEPVQVLKYTPGMYYRLHVDNAYDINPRYITFQIYLTDVAKGGETHFPRLGLSVKPKAGRAIAWWNWKRPKKDINDNTMTVDLETEHEGVIIKKGIKWSITQWIKMFPITPMTQTPLQKL